MDAADFLKTPAHAQAAIDACMSDPQWMKAYTTKNHPAHAGAVKEMSALMQLAHPEPTPPDA